MENKRRVLVDVNILAIFLVEDHPGHDYVAPRVEEGLRGSYVPVLLDITPLRAYWIMTTKWDIEKEACEKSVRHFLESYPMVEYWRVEKKTIQHAFDLARELHHDVFDTLYIAGMLEMNASTIMTTDRDFQRLCSIKKLEYLNPVPSRILESFHAWPKNNHLEEGRKKRDRRIPVGKNRLELFQKKIRGKLKSWREEDHMADKTVMKLVKTSTLRKPVLSSKA